MEYICRKIAESAASSGVSSEPSHIFDPDRHIPTSLAHELNNLFAAIQGHTDHLLLEHGQDSELEPKLKLISEAVQRAQTVVRSTTPPNLDSTSKS